MKKNAKVGFFLALAAMASGLNAGTIPNKKVKEIKMKAEAIIQQGDASKQGELDAVIAPLKGTVYSSLGQSYKKRLQDSAHQIGKLKQQHGKELKKTKDTLKKAFEDLRQTRSFEAKAQADLEKLKKSVSPQGQATFDELKNDLEQERKEVEGLANKYQLLGEQHDEALRKIDTLKIEKEEWALERAALNKQIQK